MKNEKRQTCQAGVSAFWGSRLVGQHLPVSLAFQVEALRCILNVPKKRSRRECGIASISGVAV